ncbi:MAG: hypothetical protein BAJALOKI2v1_520003 [Promethearchaeota archaeon]|nr:MAG: hypothetical protein BAJALOKI2v1_520003 [Candidatus Lokiarchaeota archaeon]
MNLSKFNERLSKAVRLAKRHENLGNRKSAIEAWLKVSDMTLKASKSPRIESDYRNMLIQKTEQIIAHVKELKKPKPQETTVSTEARKSVKEKNDEDIFDEFPEIEDVGKVEKKEEEKQIDKDLGDEKKEKENQKPDINIEEIKNSDVKNIPPGFKEIKAPEDFKIITPHDPDYVKNQQNKQVDMSIFKRNKEKSESNNLNEASEDPEPPTDDEILLDEEDKQGNVICFACGSENPPGSSKCKDCGTEL